MESTLGLLLLVPTAGLKKALDWKGGRMGKLKGVLLIPRMDCTIYELGETYTQTSKHDEHRA